MKKRFIVSFILAGLICMYSLMIFTGCGALLVGLLHALVGTKAGFILIPAITTAGARMSGSQDIPVSGMIYIENEKTDFPGVPYQPLKGATVTIEGTNQLVTTDDRGYFSMSNIPEGVTKLIATKDNYIPFTSDTPINSTTDTTNMTQFFITPTTIDIISGRSYQLEAYGITSDGHITKPSGVKWSVNGVFAIENSSVVPIPNNNNAFVDDKGVVTGISPERIITFFAKAEINGFSQETDVLVSPGAGTLSGKVTDLSGNPVAGATVQIALTPYFTLTDASGNYFIPEVPAMIYINAVAKKDVQYGIKTTLVPVGEHGVADMVIGQNTATKFKYEATIGTTGISGSANNQFNQTHDIVFDSKSNFYVSDRENVRIQKFDKDNNFIATIARGPLDPTQATADTLIVSPIGMGIDKDDNIYICDHFLHRIQKIDSTGKYLKTFGVTNQSGTDNSHFNQPQDVAVDKDGNLYVTDKGNYRLQILDSSGNYIRTIGVTGEPGNDNNHFGGNLGTSYGPAYVAIDANDNLYISDLYPNNRIQIFTKSGQYVATMGESGVAGADNSHFYGPGAVYIDGNGNIYISDYFNHRVQMFDRDRNYLDTIGTPGIQGTSNNNFDRPIGVAVNPSNGRIYVCDSLNHRVQIFSR